jgi:hypothetical protein
LRAKISSRRRKRRRDHRRLCRCRREW